MINKSFGYGDALGFGWDVMKSNFFFFTGILIVTFLVSCSIQFILQFMGDFIGSFSPFLIIAVILVSSAVDILLSIGLIKIALCFCDDLKPGFSLLFDGLDCFWRYIGAGLLYTVIVGLSYLILVLPFILLAPPTGASFFIIPVFFIAFIPATILSIKFSLCFYFVIDKNAGPINALRASSRATDGAKGALFVFGFLCGLVNLLGILCFFIGIFATTPTIMVAMAYVYRQLCSQTPELDELGIDSGSENSIEAAQKKAGIQSGLCIRVGAGEEDQPSASSSAPAAAPAAAAAVPANPASSFSSARETEADENAAVNLSIRMSEETSVSRYTPSEIPTASEAQTQYSPPSESKPSPEQPIEAKQPSYVQITEYKPTETKKSNKVLWIIIVILGVSFVVSASALVGLGFYLRNDVNVPLIPPRVEINGILYSEDNPGVIIEGRIVKEGEMIDNVMIIKISKGSVEFEKEGRRWKQKL